jgi:hypothetical protein
MQLVPDSHLLRSPIAGVGQKRTVNSRVYQAPFLQPGNAPWDYPKGYIYFLHAGPKCDTGQLIWKVSNRSVAQVPSLYKEFSYHPWVDTIQGWFPPDASFLGLELFKWLILLVLALLSWPVFYYLSLLLVRLFISSQRPTYSL